MFEKIHIYRPFIPEIIPHLDNALKGKEVIYWHTPKEFEEGLDESVEILFCHRPPRNLWHKAPNLKLIHVFTTGVDAILPASDLPENVIIANNQGLTIPQMPEFAIAMVMAHMKGIPKLIDQQKRNEFLPFSHRVISGKTLAIIGLGVIGSEIAVRAKALGMRVIGTKRQVADISGVDKVYPSSDLFEVLSQADATIVITPLTPETENMFNSEAFSKMKTGSIFIDISRGGVTAPEALMEALNSGHVAGASLDVFRPEPLPKESPLWNTKGLIISPHMAGLAHENVTQVAYWMADNVDRLERGLPLERVVPINKGY
ncbi:D-2-hydroxyacid dehydrogenase [uncultured Pseudoteredinibacter sp.]|uniref:D-2-hydroxyacid dehydrogenase n=1 Tax=uncultured Pseudoteredinibacter sp. TaxID=1641701 RepID=UPI002605B9F7|nr:D-2-hydroxyacid dehydrogenase [uncultured Pseudoteredinibacter sp.]